MDRKVSDVAARQHAALALRQLVGLGLSASAVRGRVASGRLHRIHSGVVAVVPPNLLTGEGRVIAAVLACAPGTVASHRAAADLIDLRIPGRRWVDVTTPGSKGRRRADIHVHDGLTLTTRDVTVVDAIPCTTVARTLLDIAGDATRREVERAIVRAEHLRLLDLTAIDDVLARAHGRRGTKLIRAVLEEHGAGTTFTRSELEEHGAGTTFTRSELEEHGAGTTFTRSELEEHGAGTTFTRSELEELFLAICRAASLRPDGVNVWIPYAGATGGGAEADFVWLAQRLIAEVDGRAVHATRRAFETDRRRDQQLMLLGWRVVRFSWRQVVLEPGAVERTLRGLLAAAVA